MTNSNKILVYLCSYKVTFVIDIKDIMMIIMTNILK